MPKRHSPRHGSLAFVRCRAASPVPRIRSWPVLAEPKLAGFPGYKVGMCHAIVIDNRPGSPSAGMRIAVPVTVLECPPIRLIGAVGYNSYGKAVRTVLAPELPEQLGRLFPLPKKAKAIDQLAGFEIRALIATQPWLAGFGRKKPDVLEIAVGGRPEQGLELVKSRLGKEIALEEVLTPGQQLDVHAVTKGKGIQGPVKRFGVAIRQHKAEKTKRGPGTLGPWTGPRTWRVAHAGQTGYQQRTERNKWLLRIEKGINSASGWKRYGLTRTTTALLHGSVPGPAKRLVLMTRAGLPCPKIPPMPPQLVQVCL